MGIGLFELAAKQADQRIFIDATSAVGGPTWPNGCHVCEVEVDPDTGHVAVVAYASGTDIGRVVSPTSASGQIEGGVVQGLGQALCEVVIYDRTSGQILTASFQDYAMPRADIASSFFETVFDTRVPSSPTPFTPRIFVRHGTRVSNTVLKKLLAMSARGMA